MALGCKSCGAALGERDRYCVACGMANVEGSRHPRFGPVAEPQPLYPEPRAPGADEVLCLRCERPSSRTDTYCAWCGMEMELAVLAADRAETEGVWTTWGPPGTRPYRSLAPLSTALRVVLLAVAVLGGAALVLIVGRFVAVEGDEVLGIGADSLADWSDRTMWLLAGLGAIAAVLTVVWSRRAAQDLVALCVRDARFAPWLAWACWFLPVANLVLPMLVVDDLWRCSGPDGPPLTRARRNDRPPFALHLWWPCVALGVLLVVVARLAMPTQVGVDVDSWRVVLVLGAIGAVVLVVGALALAVVVDDVTMRQRARADALGPPAWARRSDGGAESGEEVLVPVASIRKGDDGPTWGRY